MASSCSARAQVQTEDSNTRVTKKVKARDKEDGTPEDTIEEERPASFREALLNVPGVTGEENVMDEEWTKEWNDEDLPENRWYKDPVEQGPPEGQVPVVHVSDEEMLEWCEQWNQTLVVHVLGKKVNYRVLENKVNRDWARAGKVKIIDMPRGFYAVNFENMEDYKHVLFEGPWMVADHYLLVQRWRPNFLRSAKKESKVAVWVRIPELPLELYNRQFLERLGKSLGSFLKIDHLTSIQSRGQFARICVEIDLARPLQPKVYVRGEALKLEYEGLHSICFQCGVYGHRVESCPKQVTPLQKSAIPPVHSDEVDSHSGGSRILEEEDQGNDDGLSRPSPEKRKSGVQVCSSINGDGNMAENPEVECQRADYGPWMLVKKGFKKRKGSPTAVIASKVGGIHQSHNTVDVKEKGSRFGVLKKQGERRTEQCDMEMESTDMDGSTSGPPRDTLLGKKSGSPSGGPSNVTRTRNAFGGKNPQSGPRLRDVKKAARVGSSFKKVKKVIGPKISVGKENIQPNDQASLKGKLTPCREPDPVNESPPQGSHSTELTPIVKILIPNLPKKKFMLETGGDPNPLLGFIDPGEFDGESNEKSGQQVLMNGVNPQSKIGLSEPNPKNGSK